MRSLETLVDAINRHAPADGLHRTSIPGLQLAHSSKPTTPMPVIYEPTLCLVAQGRKQVMLARTAYEYDAATFLVASVGLPVVGSIIEASQAAPYLCLVLDLDVNVLSELALRYAPRNNGSARLQTGIALSGVTPELLNTAARLVSLLDAPDDIEALSPLVIREMLYRLLTGKDNGIIRQLAKSDSRLNQIARAIAWLRSHYAEPCRIEEIADIASMSRSCFHTHFKAVTSMSPLEFRDELRLHEARRLMVAEAIDASSAGYRVGYESPSQFSRHYTRMFGVPPATDAKRLRDAIKDQ